MHEYIFKQCISTLSRYESRPCPPLPHTIMAGHASQLPDPCIFCKKPRQTGHARSVYLSLCSHHASSIDKLADGLPIITSDNKYSITCKGTKIDPLVRMLDSTRCMHALDNKQGCVISIKQPCQNAIEKFTVLPVCSNCARKHDTFSKNFKLSNGDNPATDTISSHGPKPNDLDSQLQDVARKHLETTLEQSRAEVAELTAQLQALSLRETTPQDLLRHLKPYPSHLLMNREYKVHVENFFSWCHQNDKIPLVSPDNVRSCYPDGLSVWVSKKWATAMSLLNEYQIYAMYRACAPEDIRSLVTRDELEAVLQPYRQ